MITSTDTYDIVSSSLIVLVQYTYSSRKVSLSVGDITHELQGGDNVDGRVPQYYRVSVSAGGAYSLEKSTDGASWTSVYSTSVDPNLFRSVRVTLDSYGVIGSINPTLASPSNANFLQFF